MIKDIQELNFPDYATLTGAVCSLPDMGEKTITSTVKIDGDIAPDFSFDWEVAFKGEKYIMPLRKPQGLKDNESILSSIDLTFQHWVVWQLKRWPFFSIINLEAENVLPDQYVYPISLNLGDFCTLFGKVLKYYYGDSITIDLNPAWEYNREPASIEISHTIVWDVLIKFYELFAVRWQIEPNGDINHYVIKVGYPTTEITHTFEYGFEGGLLKVERQVQDENIRNMIIGRGGDKNLPYRYFKQHDENNVSYSPDPDWVPELADRYFSELHGATFRSYVQGWNHRHYKRTSVTSADKAYSPWAWIKGYNDIVFNPVEFVTDEIVANAQTGDRYIQLLPDFNAAIKKDSSIDKYGPLVGFLDNNEDIYPTIQGVTIPSYGRIDQAVAVQKILTDDIEASTQSDAVITKNESYNCKGCAYSVDKSSYKSITLKSNGNFTVSKGKSADLVVSLSVLSVNESGKKLDIAANAEIEAGSESIWVYNTLTGERHSASGIPEGTWRYEISCRVHNMTIGKTLNIIVGDNDVKLVEATPSDQWGDTWDIWVKNIWQTEKLAGETDKEYAERVWVPILGDRTGEEAKIVFSSGWLSTSEDYEFTIVATPVYDTSKSLDGVQSHWRITLAKSDADLKAIGLYLPSTKRQANAGDYFFFIGIDMPHLYVVEAEKRLDDWKKDELAKVSDIKPTWVVSLDKVRIHNHGNPGAIIDSIHPGDTFTLRDERFISGSHQEKLYLTSVTYTYTEPTDKEANLLPDVEVVLSDSYTTSASPVATLQGEVSALQKQVGAISNIEQIVRAVSDKLYLRKDGFSDRSYSPTEFASLLMSVGFRNGIIGGSGWGFFKDENDNWVLETDRLNVRQDMTVSTLVINQAEGRGGMQIDTAAYMEVTRVEETDDTYICYFDQKQGTVANLFRVDDVAFNQRWTPENQDLKYYKRKVVAVGDNYISLSKSIKNGSGIPAVGDIVIHYGNYTDKTRQYIKVRDVVGGGYERFIDGLNSVNTQGEEYYFVGRQSGMYNGRPRFYVGDENGYIEWVDGELNIKGKLSVSSTIGGKTFEQYIQEVSPKVTREDIEGFVNNIVGPDLDKIQKQIDGAIETWFSNGEPKLTTYPASEWDTEALREQHSGDLYYDNTTGTAWRFSKDADGKWYWNTITDDAITKALAEAQKAHDLADGKRRTFATAANALPKPPYDAGDVWYNATYTPTYSNDILRCTVSRKTGETPQLSDWTLASKYTDDALAQQAQKDASDAQKAITGLATYVNGEFKKGLEDAFADGIITATEKAELDGYINIINNTLASCKGTYDTLHGNAHLTGDAKTGLQNAYTDLSAKTAALVKAIQDAVADDKVTTTERTAVDNAFTAFNTSSEAFNAAVETANKAIQDVLKSYSDDALKNAKDAQEAADNAKTAADNAKTAADDANARLNEWAADGVISPTEKQGIKDEIARIDADKSQILSQYNQYQKYITGTTTAYTTAHKEYREALESLCDTKTWGDTIDIPDNFETLQGNYYTQRTLCLQRISLAADKYAKDLVDALDKKFEEEVANYEYLKKIFEAANETTTINGGVIFSSILSLGRRNTSMEAQQVTAGINGIMDKETDTALWLGGDMADRFDSTGALKPPLPPGSEIRYANTLFRFDGTGYLAKGNLYWDADGAISAANGNFRIDKNGGLHLGSGVYIGEDESKTLGTILNFITMFNSLLIPEDSDGNAVTDLSKATRLHATVGLYSDKFLTALGLNPDGSHGAAVDLTGYAKENWVKEYIADLDLGGKVDLSGYALKSEIPSIPTSLKNPYAVTFAAGAFSAQTYDGSAAKTVNVPTHTSHLTNNSGFITAAAIPTTMAWSAITGKPNLVTYSTQSVATTNGTNLATQIINIENENLISGYQNYWNVINLGSYSGNNFRSQIAMPYQNSITDTDMFIRTASSTTWRAWRRVLTDGNYSSILGNVYQPKGNYVTTDTAQTISGAKTFSTNQTFLSAVMHRSANRGIIIYSDLRDKAGAIEILGANGVWSRNCMEFSDNGSVQFVNNISSKAFIKSGGTSSQFLKADGSVDSNTYLTSHQALDHINSLGRVTAITDKSNITTGLSMVEAYSNGYPCTYGNVIRVKGSLSSGSGELLLGWSGTNNAVEHLYYRNNRDSITSFSEWRTIAFTSDLTWGNIASKPNSISGYGITDAYTKTEIGNNYLPRSGGSMTNTNLVTNLNADLLDGVHNGDLTAKVLKVVPIGGVGDTVGNVKVKLLNAVKGTAWGNVATVSTNLFNNWNNDNAQITATSYCSVINVTPQYDGDTYGQYLCFHYNEFSPFIIGRNYNKWSNVRYFAFTDSNVASATRLQGTYRLWGQNFYGNNVSGDMTGVGSITASGELVIPTVKIASYLFLKNTGGTKGLYFNTQTSGDSSICSHENYSFKSTIATITYAGSVGIGTTSPAYKLDVNGTMRVNNDLSLTGGGWLLCCGHSANYSSSANTLCGAANIVFGNGEAGTANVYHPLMYTKTSGGYYWGLQQYNNSISFEIYNSSKTLVASTGWNCTTGVFVHSKNFQCQGNISCANLASNGYVTAKNTSSDIRRKNVLAAAEIDLNTIARSPLVWFNWRDGSDPSRQIGTIAQYWERHIPEVVRTDNDGFLHVEYGVLATAMGVTLSRIVERNLPRLTIVETEVDRLKRRVRELESEVEYLKKERV